MEHLLSDVAAVLDAYPEAELRDAYSRLLTAGYDPENRVIAEVLATTLQHLIERELDRRSRNVFFFSKVPQGKREG